jgi:hypothetical protein
VTQKTNPLSSLSVPPWCIYCAISQSSQNSGTVCIVDPRHSDADTAVRIQTPTSFLPDIAKGSFELGDADEPTNSYSFGKHAEFFKLKFVGKCQCQSGYVGLIASESMGGARAALDWEAFREGVDQETISFPNKDTGFLFAGPVVHSDSVSVFKFEEGGRVAGLLITSDAEELD